MVSFKTNVKKHPPEVAEAKFAHLINTFLNAHEWYYLMQNHHDNKCKYHTYKYTNLLPIDMIWCRGGPTIKSTAVHWVSAKKQEPLNVRAIHVLYCTLIFLTVIKPTYSSTQDYIFYKP